MVELCALASGSSGNCFFAKANGSSFLVDAGISCKQIVERLSGIGRNINDVKGIFVTHAHSDHVKGADVLMRKFNIPMYVTQPTFEKFSHLIKQKDNINFINANETFGIGDVKINPFSKSHDCADPVSYSITYNRKTMSVITDIGYACSNVKKAVKESDVMCLETNHDIDMLQNGPYPYFLKKRISSKVGHISNYDAALLVMDHASPKLRHVFLSHLSLNNNTQDLAMEAFRIIKERKDLKDMTYSLTFRGHASEVFRV